MKTEWLCRGMALDDAAIAWESAVRCRPEDPTEAYLAGLDHRLETYRQLLLEQAGAVGRVLSRLPPPREEADDPPGEEAGQGGDLQPPEDPPEKVAGAYQRGAGY